jgi:adenosylmethionine-8-amino-7-oxononanoate aminotransferase
MMTVQQKGAAAGAEEHRPSNLFYLTRLRRPLIDRAEGIYMWTKDGRRFIDGSSGAMVVNVGHGNRNVIEAMKRQLDRVTFAYRLHFENEPAEELATLVASKMPGDLDRIFFVSGGSEAVESAVKLARQWAVVTGQAKRWKIIGRFPSYHGGTIGALSVTGDLALTETFAPQIREMPTVPAPTAYRDRDNLTMEQRGMPTCSRKRSWPRGRTACLPSSWSPSAARRRRLSCRRTATSRVSAKSATVTASC